MPDMLFFTSNCFVELNITLHFTKFLSVLQVILCTINRVTDFGKYLLFILFNFIIKNIAMLLFMHQIFQNFNWLL